MPNSQLKYHKTKIRCYRSSALSKYSRVSDVRSNRSHMSIMCHVMRLCSFVAIMVLKTVLINSAHSGECIFVNFRFGCLPRHRVKFHEIHLRKLRLSVIFKMMTMIFPLRGSITRGLSSSCVNYARIIKVNSPINKKP